MLVDVGTEDQFLKDGQLEPDTLKDAAKENEREEGEVQVRMQEGYDHSYYFVSFVIIFPTDHRRDSTLGVSGVEISSYVIEVVLTQADIDLCA